VGSRRAQFKVKLKFLRKEEGLSHMGMESRQKWRGAEGKFKKLWKNLMKTESSVPVSNSS